MVNVPESLPVTEIRIDAVGQLLVQVEASAHARKALSYVYRMANGTRWNNDADTLFHLATTGMQIAERYGEIERAAREECGLALELRPGTQWVNVSRSDQATVAGKYGRHAT
jgi:hypothetical protein